MCIRVVRLLVLGLERDLAGAGRRCEGVRAAIHIAAKPMTCANRRTRTVSLKAYKAARREGDKAIEWVVGCRRCRFQGSAKTTA
jgi:hypothetical protein